MLAFEIISMGSSVAKATDSWIKWKALTEIREVRTNTKMLTARVQ